MLTNLSSPAAADQSGINASGTGIDGTSGGNWVSLTATLPAGTNAVRVPLHDRRRRGRSAASDRQHRHRRHRSRQRRDRLKAGRSTASSGRPARRPRSTSTPTWPRTGMYDGHDTSLATAYNFGFLNTKPDWVEHYPSRTVCWSATGTRRSRDNSVGDHPGGGLILPVDAHPTHEHWANGQYMRQRIQSYDSTFGLERTDAITLNLNSSPTTIASKPAVPVFNDLQELVVRGRRPRGCGPRPLPAWLDGRERSEDRDDDPRQGRQRSGQDDADRGGAGPLNAARHHDEREGAAARPPLRLSVLWRRRQGRRPSWARH